MKNKVYLISFLLAFILLFDSVFAQSSTTKPLEFEIFVDYYFNSNLSDVFGNSKDGVMTAYNNFNEYLKKNNLADTFSNEIKNVKNSLGNDKQNINYSLNKGVYDSSSHLVNGVRRILKTYSDSFSNIGGVYSKGAKNISNFLGINQLGNNAKIKEFMSSNSFHIDSIKAFTDKYKGKNLGLSKKFLCKNSRYLNNEQWDSCFWYSSLGNNKYLCCFIVGDALKFAEYDANLDYYRVVMHGYFVSNYTDDPANFEFPLYYYESDGKVDNFEDHYYIKYKYYLTAWSIGRYSMTDFTFGYYIKNGVMYIYCSCYDNAYNVSLSYYGKKNFNLSLPNFKSYNIPDLNPGNFYSNNYTYNYNYNYEINNITGNSLDDKLKKIMALNDSDREKYLDEFLKQKKINEQVQNQIGGLNDKLKDFDDRLSLLDKGYNDLTRKLSDFKDNNDNKINTLTSTVKDVNEKANSLFDIFGKIKDFFEKFFAPPSKSLNFDSFKNLSLKDKFPFCVPGDIKNILSNLVASEKVPKWDIKILNSSFVIDFSIFSSFSKISKGFCILSYCVGLAFVTKKIID